MLKTLSRGSDECSDRMCIIRSITSDRMSILVRRSARWFAHRQVLTISSLFGYDQGDLASILTVGSFRRRFPQTDTIGNPGSAHTAVIQGITVGIWNLGCFVSAMLTIFWGDKVGRRKTILTGLIFLGIGEIVRRDVVVDHCPDFGDRVQCGCAGSVISELSKAVVNGHTLRTVGPCCRLACTAREPP